MFKTNIEFENCRELDAQNKHRVRKLQLIDYLLCITRMLTTTIVYCTVATVPGDFCLLLSVTTAASRGRQYLPTVRRGAKHPAKFSKIHQRSLSRAGVDAILVQRQIRSTVLRTIWTTYESVATVEKTNMESVKYRSLE